MKGDSLTDSASVSRYCKPTWVDRGQPSVAAFEMSENSKHLSVNWLEHFASLGATSRDAQLQRVRDAFRAKGYGLRRNGRFAVLPVGASRDRIAAKHSRGVDFRHWPEDGDESHAGIVGYGPEDFAIALELKNMVTPEGIFAAVP